jgi:hypothetical protein
MVPMESIPLVIVFIFLLLRLFSDKSNPDDAAELSSRAEQFAINRNYARAEGILQHLVKTTERRQGKDTLEIASYLRRLARLKMEQGDQPGAELLLQRVLAIQ